MCYPVAGGGAEFLGESDGCPIERFHFRRGHGVHRDGALRPKPKAENGGETDEQQHMVTESPPVSPSVVAAILMIQKTKVTSGTLLKPSSEFLFISCIGCAIYG